jgi:2-polyprenyl-3-methyl-5-hydroxy-6-metoxy-1,4-benzoquinol methylase
MKRSPRTDWNDYARDRAPGRHRLLLEHHQGVLRDFLEFFSAVPLDSRILDIGCASGFFLVLLRELGFENIEGADASEVFVERAAKKGLRSRVMDISDPQSAAPVERCDIAILMEVLEHLRDPRAALERVKELFLEEDGRLFITVPIYDSLTERLRFLARKEGRLERASEHDPTHVHAFTEKQVYEVIGKAGLKVVESKRIFCPLPFLPSRRLRTVVNLVLPSSLRGMFLRVVASRPEGAREGSYTSMP